jgi:arsenate reductase
MAEGWARRLKADRIEPHSAGLEARGLDARAVQVMAEAGVDISAQKSKTLADLADVQFDFVITVCSHAHETCPAFPRGAEVVHVGFDDPPALARSAATEEQALACYRRVRDESAAYVRMLPQSLPSLRA